MVWNAYIARKSSKTGVLLLNTARQSVGFISIGELA